MSDLRTLLLNQDTGGGELFESPRERLAFYRSEIHFEAGRWPSAPPPISPPSRF